MQHIMKIRERQISTDTPIETVVPIVRILAYSQREFYYERLQYGQRWKNEFARPVEQLGR